MLKQGSVGQLRRGELTRGDGYLVVTMRFYPRGLRRGRRDEYLACLAPERALLADFKRWQPLGHDEAFAKSRYLERFSLSPAALAELERLSELARGRDVYLICQCEPGERCHRELLMLLAKKRFGARIARVARDYSRARILKS